MKTLNIDQPENILGSVLWVGNTGVALENMGEGHDGRYDWSNNDDEPLLQLDFMQVDAQGEPLETDGSACTLINANTASPEQLQRFLEMAMAHAQKHVVHGQRSFKTLVDVISNQDASWDGSLGLDLDTPDEIAGIVGKYPDTAVEQGAVPAPSA